MFQRLTLTMLFFSYGMWLFSQGGNFLIPQRSLEASELFEKAEKMLVAQEWSKAVAIYQRLLERHSNQLIEVSPNLYANVSSVVLKKLKSLPSPAQSLYQNYANSHIPNITIESNKISDIFPYLTTEKGQNILMEMIDRLLIQEKYQDALSHLQYFQIYNSENEKYLAGNLARIGFCYFALGNIEALENLKTICRTSKLNKVLLAGQEQEVWEFLEKLEKHNEQRLTQLNVMNQWNTFGGNISRNFRTYHELDGLKLSWQTRLPSAQREKKGNYYNESNPNVRMRSAPHYPIIAEGMLLINNGQIIVAYDIFSGEEKWRWNGLLSTLLSEEHEQLIHSLTYHQGAIYANVEGPTPTQQAESWSIYEISKIIAERKLIKLSARTGKLIWQVKDESTEEESFGNKVSFMTPPIFWDNCLYVGATELTGLFNSYLLAIHPDTGKILRKTLLFASQQELNMFGRPVREAVGSVVSGGNGNFYFLTNLGACACVQANGDILWLYVYNRIPIDVPRQALYSTVYRDIGWRNSPVILAGNSLIFAPIDSYNLYCLDADTGNLRWLKTDRQAYLLGFSKNKVFVGKNNILAYDIETGTKIHDIPLVGDMVVGTGLVSDKYLYCPGNFGLYRVNWEKNIAEITIYWTSSTRGKPGNLVASGAVLAYATKDELAVHYNWELIADQIEKKINIQASANDYLRLASIYSQRAKQNPEFIEKAIQMYRKTLELSQPNDSYYLLARQGLLQIYLQLAKSAQMIGDWEKAYQYYRLAFPLVEMNEQAIGILVQIYYYHRHHANFSKMNEVLETLYKEYGQESYFFPDKFSHVLVAIYAMDELAQIALEQKQPEIAIAWLQKMLLAYPYKHYNNQSISKLVPQAITRIIQKYGRTVYAKYDAFAQELYEKAKQNPNDVEGFQKIVEQYPNANVVPFVHLELISKLFLDKNFKKAIMELRDFSNNYPDHPGRSLAYYLLVESYEQVKSYSLAKNTLLLLEARYKKDSIIWNGQTIQLSDYVSTKLGLPIYTRINENKKPLLELGDSLQELPMKYTFDNIIQYPTLRLLSISGAIPSNYQDRVFFHHGQSLLCRSSSTGELLWQRYGVEWLYGVGFVQDALITWSGRTVLRIDPDTGEIIWQEDIPEVFISIEFGNTVFGIVSRDTQHNTSSFSILTPDKRGKRWTGKLLGEPGNLLISNDCVIFYTRTPGNLSVYDINSGDVLKSFAEGKQNNIEWEYHAILLGSQYMCVLYERKIIECFEIPTLKSLWKYDTGGVSISGYSIQAFPIILGNEQYLAFVKNDQQLVLIETSNGEIRWKRKLQDQGNITRILAEDDYIYYLEYGDQTQNLYGIDSADGQQRWVLQLAEDNTIVNFLITQRYLVLLSSRYSYGYISRLLILDKANGQKYFDHFVKNGERSNDYAEMIVSGNLLWLVKNNKIWAIGK